MEFEKYTSFVNGVKENDLLMVKSQLAEMIMLFQGDTTKIMQAAEYAENNCTFKFETNQETITEVDKTSNSDMFYTEISDLQINFSKERFLEAIRLYPLMVEQDDFFNKEIDNEIESEVKQSSKVTTTNLIIGAGIIIGGIILYKFLK